MALLREEWGVRKWEWESERATGIEPNASQWFNLKKIYFKKIFSYFIFINKLSIINSLVIYSYFSMHPVENSI